MARHAAAVDAELSENSIELDAPAASDGVENERDGGSEPKSRSGHEDPKRTIVAVALMASTVLAAVAAWFSYGIYQDHQRQTERDRLIAVARQAALNLTTIDFNHADADVAHILNAATGTFLNDFQKRAQPFISVVQQAKSKSQGIVTDAGLEKVDGDHGQVLVAVQVETSTEVGPVGEPRAWRMRLDIQRVGSDFKVANVQFVS